jgi:hypothetical protein
MHYGRTLAELIKQSLPSLCLVFLGRGKSEIQPARSLVAPGAQAHEKCCKEKTADDLIALFIR